MAISDCLPPNDDRAEMALLGAIIRDNRALTDVGALQSGHFIDPVLGRIFDSLVARITTGLPADLITLREDFSLSGALEEVGGPQFLNELAARPSPASVSALAKRIQDLWLRRQLIAVFQQQLEEVEEWLLNAHSITSRASAQQIGQAAMTRTAEMFAVFQSILAPLPPMLMGGPGDVVRIVIMSVSEVAELAEWHAGKAEEERQEGNFFYELRLIRAEQLHRILAEAPA